MDRAFINGVVLRWSIKLDSQRANPRGVPTRPKCTPKGKTTEQLRGVSKISQQILKR